jgi:hypothetical protein
MVGIQFTGAWHRAQVLFVPVLETTKESECELLSHALWMTSGSWGASVSAGGSAPVAWLEGPRSVATFVAAGVLSTDVHAVSTNPKRTRMTMLINPAVIQSGREGFIIAWSDLETIASPFFEWIEYKR